MKRLNIVVENMGLMPAVGVTIRVTDSGGFIESDDIFLGAIFPNQQASIWIPVPEALSYAPDRDQSHFGEEDDLGRVPYIAVYAEGVGAGLVTCQLTYQVPPRLGFIPWKPFHTCQPFRLRHDGTSQPAHSRQAKIT